VFRGGIHGAHIAEQVWWGESLMIIDDRAVMNKPVLPIDKKPGWAKDVRNQWTSVKIHLSPHEK
jgi:hypothetical protein